MHSPTPCFGTWRRRAGATCDTLALGSSHGATFPQLGYGGRLPEARRAAQRPLARDCDGVSARLPPSDPDIHRAGRGLAAFLSRTAALWERDLAGVEWARADVFFGADATPLARDDLARLDPAEFPALPQGLVPASAFVVLASNADDLWSAVEDGLHHPPSRQRRAP